MKTLLYYRHSLKGTGENAQIIMQPGFDATEKTTTDEIRNIYEINHVFAGPLKRTWQTLVTILASIQSVFCAKVHEEIAEIGSDELFNHWKGLGVKFGGKPNIDAMSDDLNSDEFTRACENALQGVKKMFDQMEDDETGLAVGHSPVIEMATNRTGLSMAGQQLKENEFVIFEQDTQGNITAHFPN